MTTEEQLDQLVKEVKALAITVTEYTTVTRRHVTQQEAIVGRLQRILDKHDLRLRDVETWQAVKDKTLPDTLLDADNIKQEIDSINTKVDAMGKTLAKWAGVAALAWVAFQAVAGPAIRWALAWLNGGGS